MYIAQKYLTFNHRFKIHPAQSNSNLQRILRKLLNKMSKIQLSSISKVKMSRISILRVLSHFYYSKRFFRYPYWYSNLHIYHNPHVMICHKMTQNGNFMTYFDIWHFVHDVCNMARCVSKEPS